jgi:NDP-mannose synthase
MSNYAVIICGGKGSRLAPYTDSIPKALLPIHGYPILEIIIRQLKYYGFTHITLSIHHLADDIIKHFGNGHKWNLHIDYSLEEFPLGTAGPLKILKDLPESFLVANCDILTDLNFAFFLKNHLDNDGIFTIAAYKKQHRIGYGIIQADKCNYLANFFEKPDTIIINAGVYIMNKEVQDYIPEKQAFGVDDLIHKLLEHNEKIRIYPFAGSWQDIGSVDEYVKASAESDIKRIIHFL